MRRKAKSASQNVVGPSSKGSEKSTGARTLQTVERDEAGLDLAMAGKPYPGEDMMDRALAHYSAKKQAGLTYDEPASNPPTKTRRQPVGSGNSGSSGNSDSSGNSGTAGRSPLRKAGPNKTSRSRCSTAN